MSKIFVDELVYKDLCIEEPTLEDLELMINALEESPFSFELGAHHAVGGLTILYQDGLFAVFGADEIRGVAYCILNEEQGDEIVFMDIEEVPKYSTTHSLELVTQIAKTYFESGKLNPCMSWHVVESGLWGPINEIPENEKFEGRYSKINYENFKY